MWPRQACWLVGYMGWPNDSKARAALRLILQGWSTGSRVVPPRLRKMQSDWVRVGHIFSLHYDGPDRRTPGKQASPLAPQPGKPHGVNTMAGPPPRLHLPYAEWPAEDRRLWISGTDADDPFSEVAGARLAKTTLHCRQMAWRRFLGFLAAAEPEALCIPPAQRITKERVRQFANHLGESNTPNSTACQIDAFYGAVRILLPGNDWRWLRELKARLFAAAPNPGGRGPVITSLQLIELGRNIPCARHT